MPSADDLYYRYHDFRMSVDEYNSRCVVRLETFEIERVTPKGVWLKMGKFILNNARKRYAYPTKELAMDSFIARKQRQLIIRRRLLRETQEALYEVGIDMSSKVNQALILPRQFL